MNAIPLFFDEYQTRGLQMALNEKTKSSLKIDGDFGPASIGALRTYQIKNKIPSTGNYDSNTAAVLGTFLADKYLTAKDFIYAAAELGCSAAAIKAVAQVEAPQDGFINDGRCTILFERHKFYGYLSKKVSASELSRLCVQEQDIVSTAPGGYKRGNDEWERFQRAFAIDADSAMLSTSWGMFQIMGFNHKAAGYPNVVSFVKAMEVSQRNHLTAFVSFIKSESRLVKAIREKNWVAFAAAYNGPAHAANNYAPKMAAAFINHSTAQMA